MTQHRPVDAERPLLERLTSSMNTTGGCGYYPGRASRIEPTCWALLATNQGAASPHTQFLRGCQQGTGWLIDVPGVPPNIGFNALAALVWFLMPQLGTADSRDRLVRAIVDTKGVQAENGSGSTQDNSLQGWPWIDATFSWVEPTSWALVALKQARRAGFSPPNAEARIAEGERVLVNRACVGGGWNYGNARVLDQDLRPYVPTSALALLALQDRRSEAAVEGGLAFLQAQGASERSPTALGLALLCLDAYGRPSGDVEQVLRQEVGANRGLGNLHGQAVALYALTHRGSANAFRF